MRTKLHQVTIIIISIIGLYNIILGVLNIISEIIILYMANQDQILHAIQKIFNGLE